jgi:WD40 repeat protein
VVRQIPVDDWLPYQLAYNNRGDAIAVSGAGGDVRVWRAADTPVWHREGHSSSNSVVVAWSPDDAMLATGGLGDGRVMFWDAADGHPSGTVDAGGVSSIAYRSDGSELLVAGGDHALRHWSVSKKDWEQHVPATVYGARTITVSPRSGTVLAVPAGGPSTLLREDRWLRQATSARSLAYSADGRLLSAGGADGWVRSWDAPTHAVRAAWTWGSDVVVAPGRDGTLILASKEHVQIGGTDSGFEFPGRAVAGIASLPAGRILITASQPGPGMSERATVALLDPTSWQLVASLELDGQVAFTRPAISRDGSRAAVASTTFERGMGVTSRYELVVVATDPLVRQRQIPLAGRVDDLAVTPDGRRAVTVGADRQITVWDLDTGDQVVRFGTHPGPVRSVAISPDASTVATGSSDGVIRVWNMASADLVGSLTGHSGDITAVAWSPDGLVLASAGADGAVGLWDVDPDRVRTQLCAAVSGPQTGPEWSAAGAEPGHEPC